MAKTVFSFLLVASLAVFSLASLAGAIGALSVGEVRDVTGNSTVAINLENYYFSAAYVNHSSGVPIRPVPEGGACNFTLSDPATGAVAATFPSAYFPDPRNFYFNYSNSLLSAGVASPGNYALMANCSAPGFTSGMAKAPQLVQVTRAGIRFTFDDALNARYTRFDDFAIAVTYFDALNSREGAIVPIGLGQGDCFLKVLNAGDHSVVRDIGLMNFDISNRYVYSGRLGAGGLNLPLGSYIFRAECFARRGQPFENRVVEAPFTVKPITCGFVARESITMEEDAVCTGEEAQRFPAIPVIDIQNDFVALDCAGHSIVGPANSSLAMPGVRIANGLTGVTVRNCSVRDAGVGVIANGVTSGVVANSSVSNSDNGLWGFVSSGLAVSNFSVSNVTSRGLDLRASPSSEVRNVTVDSAGSDGIFLGFSSNDVKVSNAAVSNSARGLTISNSDRAQVGPAAFTGNGIGLNIEDSQAGRFGELNFSGNALDIFFQRTSDPRDVSGNVFNLPVVVSSIATWDAPSGSSNINNVVDPLANVAKLNIFSILANSTRLDYESGIEIHNGQGINWTKAIGIFPDSVSIDRSFASALNGTVNITFSTISRFNLNAYDVLKNGAGCIECQKLEFAPVKFRVYGFSNYSLHLQDVAMPLPEPSPAPGPSGGGGGGGGASGGGSGASAGFGGGAGGLTTSSADSNGTRANATTPAGSSSAGGNSGNATVVTRPQPSQPQQTSTSPLTALFTFAQHPLGMAIGLGVALLLIATAYLYYKKSQPPELGEGEGAQVEESG